MKKVLFLLILSFFVFPVLVSAKQVDINSASLNQLDELTGIGPKYAQAIIDGRPYSSLDGLLKVKGIGEKTLAKIKEQGFACVNCESTPAEISGAEISAEKSEAKKPEIKTYPGEIFISEVLPNPEGSDETEEYIKIFNSNDFEVDLSGWKISDAIGTITNYAFPAGAKVLAKEDLTLNRSKTKIILNNDGDKVVLSNPNGEILSSVAFEKAELGQTYPAKDNGLDLPKSEKSDNNIVKTATADLSQVLNFSQNSFKDKNPWFLFFIVLIITAISAFAILFIKLKFKKK
jgi:competence ComEA-like helix-hairpin-helix protein